MAYRLIATDIDGTLLDERGKVTERARRAMRSLIERGAVVVLVTGRAPRTLQALYDDLNLNGPVIAYNGALVYAPGRPQPYVHRPMPRRVALAVLACMRASVPEINAGVELADEWHVDRIDDRLRRQLPRLPRPPLVGGLEDAIRTTERGVSKLFFAASSEVRRGFEDQLRTERIWDDVSITSAGGRVVEIHAAGVSKGAALKALAEDLEVPCSEILAIGNAENDIPALTAAGLGVAMGNAPHDVKAAAGAVTGPNTADGWAEAIERFVLAS